MTPLAGLCLTAASPARAATADHIAVAGHQVPTPANLHNPIAVERFLLAVEHAQGSTSLAFLAGASPALRAAVIATETRSGGVTETSSTGRATTTAERSRELAEVGASPNAPATIYCGWAYKKITYTPGLITYYSLWLQTDFCWSNGMIYGIPDQIHGGSASWGGGGGATSPGPPPSPGSLTPLSFSPE